MELFDAIKFLDAEGINYELRRDDSEIVMDCPMCGKERHFYYNLMKNVGFCQRCREGVSHIGLVKEVKTVSHAGAVGIVAKYTMKARSLGEIKEHFSKLPTAKVRPRGDGALLKYPLPDGFSMRIKSSYSWNRAQNFMNDRRIPPSVWHNRLGLSPAKPGYMIIPVRNQKGEVIYWTSRSYMPGFEKASNPPDKPGYYSRENALLGIEFVDKDSPIVIVEGPLDHLSVDNSVAILGTYLSSSQERILRRIGADVILCLDGGEQEAMCEIADRLKPYLGVSVVDLPEGKDPNDCIEEIEFYLASAKKVGKINFSFF